MLTFQEYADHDALGLAHLIRSGQVSAQEVGEVALRAIGLLNPQLNCIIQTYPERVAALRGAKPGGLFCGVPTALKDLYKFELGALSEGGCQLTQGLAGSFDSEVVLRMRRAGLVIIGRSTVPEMGWASACDTRLQGLTRSPWHPDLYPGGSSSGAVAAVAAGLLPLAHASDGGGSTRGPAAHAGLVGLKPTRARVSDGPGVADPNAGMSAHLAVTHTVRDTAAVLDALSGPAVGDPHQAPKPPRPFLQELQELPGRLAIAYTHRSFDGSPVNEEIANATEKTARVLESMGHRVVEAAPKVHWEGFLHATAVVWAAGMAHGCDAFGRQLKRTPGPGNLMHTTYAMYQYGKTLSAAQYLAALDEFNTVRRSVGKFFIDYDILLTPTTTQLAQPHATQNQDQHLGALEWTRVTFSPDSFSPLFNVTGQPAISLPLHAAANGLPIGMHLVARFGEDALLLRLSAALEQALPWRQRRPPLHLCHVC